MAAPQDPPVRLWQKKRRTKKLALWRAKKAAELAATGGETKTETKKPATKSAEKGPTEKKSAAAPAAKKPAK